MDRLLKQIQKSEVELVVTIQWEKYAIQLTGSDLQCLLQGSITNPTAYWLNENVSINLLYWKTS